MDHRRTASGFLGGAGSSDIFFNPNSVPLEQESNVPTMNSADIAGRQHHRQAAPAAREQDLYMPIANVIRIMRKVLPAHAKISDEAKETVQECVSEYISFITGEANERCQREQRKTITAEDLLWAMEKLGFDDYVEPLSLYLSRYRDVEGGGGSAAGAHHHYHHHHHHHQPHRAVADVAAASGFYGGGSTMMSSLFGQIPANGGAAGYSVFEYGDVDSSAAGGGGGGGGIGGLAGDHYYNAVYGIAGDHGSAGASSGMAPPPPASGGLDPYA